MKKLYVYGDGTIVIKLRGRAIEVVSESEAIELLREEDSMSGTNTPQTSDVFWGNETIGELEK